MQNLVFSDYAMKMTFEVSQIKRGIAEYFIPMQLSNVFSSTQSHSQLETLYFTQIK